MSTLSVERSQQGLRHYQSVVKASTDVGSRTSTNRSTCCTLAMTGLICSFVILCVLLQSTSSQRADTRWYHVMQNLSFSKPCPERGHDFHETTGNFMCKVRTPKDCFDACQVHGCQEWSFTSFMSIHDDRLRRHYRCRCVPAFKLCTYNRIPVRYRGYGHNDL